MSDKILDLRKKIDAIDTQIMELLHQRAGHAKAVGEEKRRVSTEKLPNFYDPEREQVILKRLEGMCAKGDPATRFFPSGSIRYVFKEIMSACRSLEADLRVSFLGPSGTFTQIAAQQSFGRSIEFIEAPTIEGVFDVVAREEAEYGVVPLENSCEGGVIQTLDALLANDHVKIRRELAVKINHCLISKLDSIGAIKKIYSHPAALAQCRQWLSENMRGAELIVSRSTAAAARSALDDVLKGEGAAAVASRLSAELLGLNVLREGIQDHEDNSTRFVILAQSDGPVTGNDRTSLVLTLKPAANSLMQVLKIFEEAGIAVSRTESRANGHNIWKYVYFIDLEGHREDVGMKASLVQLAAHCDKIKILGSYPREISK